MKVGIDIDDVVEDFVGAYLSFQRERTGSAPSYTDFISYDDFDFELYDAFCDSLQSSSLPPVAYAPEALRSLSAAGYPFVFITARSSVFYERTTRSLERFIPSPVIFFTGGGFSSDHFSKAQICLREGVDCMVEDNAYHARACASFGIKTYLLDRPWNRSDSPPNVLRVSGWRDVLSGLGLSLS